MPLPHLLIIGAALFGCTSCTSTRVASVRDIQRLEPGLERGLALETTAPWRSRLDPNTWVRFKNKRGEFSNAIRARDLRVDKRGLFAPSHGDTARALDAVRIIGMSEDALALVDPSDDISIRELAPGELLIKGPSGAVHAWAVDFLERVMARIPAADSDEHLVRAHGDGTITICEPASASGCVVARGKLRSLLRWERDMPALVGEWSLRFGGKWRPPVEGSALRVALISKVGVTMHYPWNDIAEVELTDVSGVKTFGAVVGYTALTVALLPIAALGVGFGALPGRGGPKSSGSGGSGSGSSGGRIGGSLSLGGGGSSGKRAPAGGNWGGDLETAPGPNTKRLFSGSARRKSILRLTLAADAGVDTLHGEALVERLTLGVRLNDLIEIGGGLGHAWNRGATTPNDLFGFVHLGLHLPIDAEHKIAIPIGIDLGTYMPGGYLRVKHARLNLGVRRRLTDDLFIGAYLLNPTYVATNREEKGWSFTSGLELGATF